MNTTPAETAPNSHQQGIQAAHDWWAVASRESILKLAIDVEQHESGHPVDLFRPGVAYDLPTGFPAFQSGFRETIKPLITAFRDAAFSRVAP